ncbi:IclR family transcriptional regulator [Inquilinus limosus]|uniref:IclR family transcriptional regulator n=1 Tax=Inquilinus limosus TaxID=171674 RepID=UPI00068DEAC8|nr:IclR family transcriptional regulator [Inquilinus limosus]
MTTLESAAAVLRCFSTNRTEITVTEASSLLSLPKSNISRLLRAMRDAGLLETIGDSKRYRPGPLILGVAHLYSSTSSLVGRADAVVARIVAAVGHTGYVSIRDGGEVIGLTYHPGTNVLRVATPVGRPLAAHSSATGRSLLARLSDDQVRELFREPWQPVSPTAPQTIDELLQRLERVRRLGFAESHDEANRGVGALAVAVGSPQTGEAVSLCIAYPVSTVTAEEREDIIARLLAGAGEVAALAGDPNWTNRAELSASAA